MTSNQRPSHRTAPPSVYPKTRRPVHDWSKPDRSKKMTLAEFHLCMSDEPEAEKNAWKDYLQAADKLEIEYSDIESRLPCGVPKLIPSDPVSSSYTSSQTSCTLRQSSEHEEEDTARMRAAQSDDNACKDETGKKCADLGGYPCSAA